MDLPRLGYLTTVLHEVRWSTLQRLVGLHLANQQTAHKIVQASQNHKHSVNNLYSQFRDGWSEDRVLQAPMITKSLTKFMCSPTSVSMLILVRCQYPVKALLFCFRTELLVALSPPRCSSMHTAWRTRLLRLSMALCTDGSATLEGRSWCRGTP